MPDTKLLEKIQTLAVTTIATNPAGSQFRLIGGFRLRLLDGSPRLSSDIDYHWDGSLDAKAKEIISLLGRKLLPEVKRRHGYDGSVTLAAGPEADSPFASVVNLSFYQLGVPLSRIEMPIDITRIECIDPPIVRTVAGTVYLTVSDQDMIESKVVGLFNRLFIEGRDLVDIFLFENYLGVDSPARIAGKLATNNLDHLAISKALNRLAKGRKHYVSDIGEILDNQVDPQVAARIREGGGETRVFDHVFHILEDKLRLRSGGEL